ncbi:hypothetical protein COO03_05175 [Bacillus sp. AFS098217]|uniref:hypothetical protein n=1 Tax=Bacillus sp. AFS098217 TaxID=2033868 RepID=UPI000BEE0511|nr:hypothetical protein [Bacillus sp. AFS098217]PEB54634.1 hypothetical protein COO03_05175 [Bacillus sp. AFS098217]
MNEIVKVSKERFAKYCEGNPKFEKRISTLINHYFLLLGNQANILQQREFNNEVEEERFKKDVKRFETLFPAAAKHAFLKGYQLCLEFLNHPDTQISDSLYEDPNFTKELPYAIDNASQFDLYELIRTDETQEFSVFAVRTYEGIRPLMEQIFREIALTGAELAFEHERMEKGFELKPSIITSLAKVPVDRFFEITPSVNGVVVQTEENSEIWNLFWNSKTTIDNPFIEIAQVIVVYKEKTEIQKCIEENVLYYRCLFENVPLEEIQDRLEIRVKYNLSDAAPRALSGVEIEYLLTEIIQSIHKNANIPLENMILL